MITKKIQWITLVAIIGVGLLLRAYHLGDVPFRADEFLDINATVGYAQTGQWQAWDHNMGTVSTRINPASDARAWVYRWQVAMLFEKFAPTETITRSISVFWGTLTIIIVYFVAASLTRRREIGLIAAALFALNISGIEMARTMRMYAMFTPIFLLFSWMVFLMIERVPRNKVVRYIYNIIGIHGGYGFLAVALGLLAFHLHALTANIVFVIAGYVMVMMFVQIKRGTVWKDNQYSKIIGVGMIGTIFLIIFVPQQLALLSSGIVLWEDHWSYIGHVLKDYWHPLIAVLLYVVGLSFLWLSDDALKRRGAAWIDATVGMILLAAIFLWSRNVGPQYIFFIQPFFAIGIASGIYYGARYLHAQIHGRHVFASVIALAFILVPNYAYFFQENNTYHITSRAERPDYRKVFTYVIKNIDRDAALVTRNFRNYYWSGAQIKTYDFGSERSADVLMAEGKMAKVTVGALEDIMKKHHSVWVILAQNDEIFVTKEAQKYLEEKYERVSHTNIRGPITVWYWKDK